MVRPSTMLLHISPHLQRRIEEAGFVFGSGSLEVWLVERATLLRDLLAPAEDVNVQEVLRRHAEHMADPEAGQVQVMPRSIVAVKRMIDQMHDAATVARALVQARARLAEVEQERDAAERDTAGIFEDIGHYHFSIPSPDALAEEAEAVAAVNAWAHDEDGTIEAPALAVQVRALIAAARESDAARAEVARLKRALIEPVEDTGDPDSEQGEGVAR